MDDPENEYLFRKICIEALARKICIGAGLDPDEQSPGPNSMVGIPEDAWPNWEYFWEQAADQLEDEE